MQRARGVPNVVHNSYGAWRTGLALSGKVILIRLAPVCLWSAPVGAGRATGCFRDWHRSAGTPGDSSKEEASQRLFGAVQREREEATNS